jgi:endoglucanase
MATYPTGVKYRGLNRAGAEFGDDWAGWTGQRYYAFPTAAELHTELTYYGNKGFNAIRLPISWERFQHRLNGAVTRAYRRKLLSLVNDATAAGFAVMVDLHNYNRYATGAFDGQGRQVDSYQQHIVGDDVLTVGHLANVWVKIARMLRGHQRVIFNLMNEPHDFPMTSEVWFSAVQTVINSIRATGADQLILVPNSRGSDVEHWDTYAPNGGALDSSAALVITDSASNIAFDMHAYLGEPGSSTAYVDLLTPVTQWALANNKRLFLSELGVQNGAAQGAAAVGNLLTYLNANDTVWVGWTAWNLVPYNLTADGNYTADGPQMAWYTPFLTPGIVAM